MGKALGTSTNDGGWLSWVRLRHRWCLVAGMLGDKVMGKIVDAEGTGGTLPMGALDGTRDRVGALLTMAPEGRPHVAPPLWMHDRKKRGE